MDESLFPQVFTKKSRQKNKKNLRKDTTPRHMEASRWQKRENNLNCLANRYQIALEDLAKVAVLKHRNSSTWCLQSTNYDISTKLQSTHILNKLFTIPMIDQLGFT